MAKDYEIPDIEEVEETSAEETSDSDSASTDENSGSDISNVYVKQIAEFGEFAAGKIGFETLKDKQTKMLSFVTVFDSLLRQDYQVVREGLRELLGVIADNIQVFSSGDVFSTFYTLKKIPYGYSIDRFIETITFFTALQENIAQASAYVSGRDLAYIFKDWHAEERDKLIWFANGFAG